jgi:hypothetical protein
MLPDGKRVAVIGGDPGIGFTIAALSSPFAQSDNNRRA